MPRSVLEKPRSSMPKSLQFFSIARTCFAADGLAHDLEILEGLEWHRRRRVVERREAAIRAAHGQALRAQQVERLRARDLVHQVQVDVQHGRSVVGFGRDDVLRPIPSRITTGATARPCDPLRRRRAGRCGRLSASPIGSEPTPAIGRRAVEQPEEQVLQLLRDRAALAFADGNLVDGAHGRDLRGGARQEHLVGDVQQLARDVLLERPRAPADSASRATVSRVMPDRIDAATGGL